MISLKTRFKSFNLVHILKCIITLSDIVIIGSELYFLQGVCQSVANIPIFEYICEYSLRIIFIFIFAVKKNYE